MWPRSINYNDVSTPDMTAFTFFRRQLPKRKFSDLFWPRLLHNVGTTQNVSLIMFYLTILSKSITCLVTISINHAKFINKRNTKFVKMDNLVFTIKSSKIYPSWLCLIIRAEILMSWKISKMPLEKYKNDLKNSKNAL